MQIQVADYEKLGAFDLGRGYDAGERKLTDELTMYDSWGLVTHGVVPSFETLDDGELLGECVEGTVRYPSLSRVRYSRFLPISTSSHATRSVVSASY